MYIFNRTCLLHYCFHSSFRELEETFEPGEVEVWAEIEALTNSNAPRPVVTFEEGVATGELDDLLESVRERLKKICPNTQKFGVTTPGELFRHLCIVFFFCRYILMFPECDFFVN